MSQYAALYGPIFDRRRDITLGYSAPTAEELAAGEAESRKDDGEDYTPIPTLSPSALSTDISKANPGTGIPEFWLTALRNHVGISELITERDADCLKHLTDVRVSYLPEDKTDASHMGFKLTFFFSPNEFFTNELLTKSYIYRDELGYEGDFVYERAVGCEINWKEDKDLTKSFEIKKQRNKSMYRASSFPCLI